MPNPFIIHGWFMTIAWGGLALLLVATNRYLGSYWKTNVNLHASLGIVTVLTTVILALYAFSKVKWALINNSHSYFVFQVLILVTMVAAGGAYTRYMLHSSVWNTQKALNVKKTHKFFAYLTILLATGGVMTGIYWYRMNPNHPSDVHLEWIYFAYFIIVAGIMEVIYRNKMKDESAYKFNSKGLSTYSFE